VSRIRLLELRSTYGWGGGPDKTILLSAELHDRSRFDVRLVYLRGAEDHAFDIGERARRRGLELLEIPERGKIDPQAIRRLARYVREQRIDIVHSHDYKTNLFAYLLFRFNRRVRIMATTHGWITDSGKKRLYNWLDRRVLRGFPAVVSVSAATRDILVRNGVAPRRITVIHNGIDDRAWSAEGVESTFREELGLPAGAPLVGMVGRLGEEKDLRTLLDAMRAVLLRHPQGCLALVGDGSERGALERYAADSGIGDHVVFTGYRKDLRSVYKALDLHVITSVTEGLPNNLLEAMAMGVPTISTPVGGIPEIVEDGHNGCLVRVGDAEGLARRILALLEDRAEYARIQGNARASIEQRFSFAARMRKIEAFYEFLMRTGRGPGPDFQV